MAENVMVDGRAAHWFDFETVHDSNRPLVWRRADDLRALLVTCMHRTVLEKRAETLRLMLDAYADLSRRSGEAAKAEAAVLCVLATSFTSVFRRPLTFHLAQAGLSFH